MKIEAVIYDFFGVLCVGSRGYILSHCHESVRQQLDELYLQADYGFITAVEFAAQAAQLLHITQEEFIKMSRQRYIRDESMIESIRRVKRLCHTALLSNANDAIIDELFSKQEQKELFDEVLVSSHVGMVKPQKELFELMASRLAIEPEACVMVDDLESNIEGAIAAGMQGIVFSHQAQYERELQKMGVYA